MADSISFPIVEGKSGWPWIKENIPMFPTQSDQTSWPKISIVTPSFNQVQFLEETIRSVLLQGYPNLEYIIIDGGSTDGSVEIIKKYEPWLKYWVSEKDGGQANAINKGFTLSTGQWRAWINSDDFYLPGAFYTLAEAALENRDLGWVVGTLLLVDANSNEIRKIQPTFQQGYWRDPDFRVGSWLDFVCVRKSGTFLPQQTSLWAKSSCEKAGELDEKLRCAFDFEYYVRLGRTGAQPELISKPIAAFRVYERQLSADEILCRNDELTIVELWLGQATKQETIILLNYQRWLKKEILSMKRRKYLNKFKIYRLLFEFSWKVIGKSRSIKNTFVSFFSRI